MALEAERLTVAHDVRHALAQGNGLTAEQARLFVRSLQHSWQVPPIRWSELESASQLLDARRLLHAAEVFREIEGVGSAGSIECYRRAGEIYEWLARADDSLKAVVPIALLSAGAYQLGELPAMATSILRQTVTRSQVSALDFDQVENQPDGDDTEPRNSADRVPTEDGETTQNHGATTYVGPAGGEGHLYTAFFQANFDETLRLVADFWSRHPELTTRAGSSSILAEDAEDRVAWYLVVEIVRVIGLSADALRRHDVERLALARRKFAGLERLAVRTTSEDMWTLLSLLRATNERFASASLYPRLERLGAASPSMEPRLRAFAREQFARGRGVLWTSQIHGLEKLADSSSFALCTPTGSGKTLVANLALVKELLVAQRPPGGPAPLAIYLVPSRALAGEVEAKLTSELGRDLIVTGLYGGADWGVTDFWLTADEPTVLIATVEKADALMRYLGPILIGRLKLLVIDEAHQVVSETDSKSLAALADHGSRAMRLESLVSRILALKPSVIRIALTAVAGGAASPVARWMEGHAEADPVGVNYRSTRQLVGTLEASRGLPGKIQLDLMNGVPLYVRGREVPVYLPLRIPSMPDLPSRLRSSLDRFNQLHILWTALQLRDGGRRILISVAQQPEQTMRWFVEGLSLAGWESFNTFSEPPDEDALRRYRDAEAACLDYCGGDSYELALLRQGIATSHGQMPQRLRRLMTDLIDRRICAITVATATLTEGVNLPFDIIFLTSLKRRSYDKAPVDVPFSTSEFRNLAGRAGRPGAAEGMEGMTLVGLPQSAVSTAPKAIPTQRRQVAAMAAGYADMLDRLAAETTPDAQVASPLALLLKLIAHHLQQLFQIQPGDEMLAWLSATLPEQITPEVGTSAGSAQAQLADSLDELDAVLLAAVEELRDAMAAIPDSATAEDFLRRLWSRSFARVAAAQEAWLEQAFIHRGRSLIDTIYPNPDQRKRLYQFGYAPTIGRRFEVIAPKLKAELAAATGYAISPLTDRFSLFSRLGELIRNQPGFGFRIRNTVGDRDILENWTQVLGWWMQAPGSLQPDADQLRAWQRFTADNLDFRLGVAIGAVVAEAWSTASGPFATPELATWRATTGFPWFGFWARELLRWGTLDPFVAFCLGQGLARTRQEATLRRPDFEAFLVTEVPSPTPDDFIDPQRFLSWQRLLPRHEPTISSAEAVAAELTGSDGARGRYGVLPVRSEGGTDWYDAAGYYLARTPTFQPQADAHRNDFDLRTDGHVRIEQTYEWQASRT